MVVVRVIVSLILTLLFFILIREETVTTRPLTTLNSNAGISTGLLLKTQFHRNLAIYGVGTEAGAEVVPNYPPSAAYRRGLSAASVAAGMIRP